VGRRRQLDLELSLRWRRCFPVRSLLAVPALFPCPSTTWTAGPGAGAGAGAGRQAGRQTARHGRVGLALSPARTNNAPNTSVPPSPHPHAVMHASY